MKLNIKIALIAVIAIRLGINAQVSDTGDKVGIGTTTPSAKLDVKGISKVEGALIVDGIDPGNPSAQLEQLRLSGYGILGNRGAMYISNENPDGQINFFVGGRHGYGSHMIIKGINGNVGIGETSPSAKLDVKGMSKVDNALVVDGIDSGNPSAQPEQLRLSGYGILGNRGAMYISNENPDGHINFFVGGRHGHGSHMIIKGTNGNVGIGETSPSAKLDVKGMSKVDNALVVDGIDSGNPSAQPEQLRLSGYGILGNRGAMYISNENPDGHINFFVGGRHGYGSHMIINKSGNVGIGETNPDSKLSVNGKIHTKEVKVDLVGWSDFVFYDDYKLPTLTEVETHIKEKGHLKDIPSAKEVAKNGILLGEMDSKLLQKIEELTLYTIAQEKDLQSQKEEIDNLKKKNETLKSLNFKLLEIQKRLDKLEEAK